MDWNRTLRIAALMMFLTTAFTQAELIMDIEYISTDNIGNMITSTYTPENGYTYRFVNGAADISDGSDFQAVRNAFGTWISEPTSDLSFSEVIGTNGFTPGTNNGSNDISWINSGYGYTDPWSDLLDFSNSAIAVVVTWYSTYDSSVSERDMYFNDIDFNWRTNTDGESFGGFFVEHIALHEIGHIYGLKDVYNPDQSGWEDWMGSDNQNLTMYGYSSWWNEDVTLSQADTMAMAELHPREVPEPQTALMFMMAGGILGFIRRS